MLLDRFHNLFGQTQSISQQGNWLEDSQQIIHILNRAQHERCLLEVKIGDHPNLFTTAIIDINAKSGLMALDEISPQDGHHQFLEHRSAHLSGRSNGVELEFDVDLMAEHSHNGIAYYQVKIPTSIIYLQRRDDYRVHLSGNPVFRGHRGLQNQQLLSGYGADLSLHGVGVVLTDLEILRRGDEMSTCVLHLPGNERLYFSLEVRFVQQIQRRGTTRIGGRFIHLSKKEKNQLARIIREIERSQAKYAME